MDRRFVCRAASRHVAANDDTRSRRPHSIRQWVWRRAQPRIPANRVDSRRLRYARSHERGTRSSAMKLTPLAIVGAGGFGREVAWLADDINQERTTYDFVGFVDDGASSTPEGYPIL